jgi:hypothetical protein
MRLNYNQFRSKHKGMPRKEVSTLWKRYKSSDYDLPPELLGIEEAPVETKELQREESELEIVKATTTPEADGPSMSKSVFSYLAIRSS